MRTITNAVENKEQTQEVRLSDGMPDIGHVLSCWGQVLIRGKEWRTDGIVVNGGVMAWVLYAPDDGSKPQCLETWLPFQMKWDFDKPAQDGSICVQPSLASIDARSTSARKIMVRASVDVLAQASVRDTVDLYLPDEIPKDICILKNTYPMMLASEGGEKTFTLEEIPEQQPAAELDRILYYNLHADVTDQKLLTDKLIFRGVATLRMLYQDPDGKLCQWKEEIPFSQYAELDRDYTDYAESAVCVVITNLELEKNGEGKLRLKAGLLGQYTIYEKSDVTVVEDAYSLKHKVLLQTETLNLPAVLDAVTETIHAQQPMEEVAGIPADAVFCPALPRLYRDDNGVGGELSGTFYILNYDAEDLLRSAVRPWSENWSLPADPNVKTDMQFRAESVDVGGGNMETEIHLLVRLLADRDITVITGLEIGEDMETDPNRPSLIVCKKGDDTLWQLAKTAGSTVEAIQRANALTQEPDAEKMLLIPVF